MSAATEQRAPVTARIAVLAGDGIGPEVTEQAVRVLEALAAARGHRFTLESALVGGAAIDATGSALPEETLAICRRSDAVLFGAIGGPKWGPSAKVRPEQGLLALRKGLGLFANLRPVMVNPQLAAASPLKPEVVAGVDLLVVRELTGGIYFGEKRRDGGTAFDACTYSEEEVARVVRVAARLARRRRKKLTSVDKANVLETSRLWREVATRVVKEEFPDVALEHQLVDSCAMQLIRRPADFDVVVTENMFGDILTDEASVIAGSIGLLPSASLGEGTFGLYEPIHGSAPDIAGRGLANPYGTIASAAMLLRHSLGLEQEAALVECAVARAVEGGALTADLGGATSTEDAGSAVLRALESIAA
ncbi:MAG TPA: 3-isopropylmalate dehydrogenase [Anaeromyxobacteraceae bacterium]|nr:3-isopropylmalate dehydrogenase [Anaeromyxobacteraceae bacterium]